MRLASIQALRGIAALAVALFHLRGTFPAGQAGVDLFFVISGFIIGSIDRNQPPLEFAAKRAIRLLPLYWAVTLAMCAAWYVPGLFSRFTFDAQTLLQSLLFIPFYGFDGQIWPLVPVGWTLNFEVWFYALFALVLAAGVPTIRVAVGLLVGLVLVGVVFQPASASLQVWTSPLLLEFAAGLLATIVATRILGARWGLLFIAAAMVLFVAPIAVGINVDRANHWQSLALWGGPAFLLVVGVVVVERAGAWPRILRPFERLGDVSYSLYLTHTLVFALVARSLPNTSLVSACIALIAAVLVAVATYVVIERGVGGMLRRAFVSRTPARDSLAAARIVR